MKEKEEEEEEEGEGEQKRTERCVFVEIEDIRFSTDTIH